VVSRQPRRGATKAATGSAVKAVRALHESKRTVAGSGAKAARAMRTIKGAGRK